MYLFYAVYLHRYWVYLVIGCIFVIIGYIFVFGVSSSFYWVYLHYYWMYLCSCVYLHNYWVYLCLWVYLHNYWLYLCFGCNVIVIVSLFVFSSESRRAAGSSSLTRQITSFYATGVFSSRPSIFITRWPSNRRNWSVKELLLSCLSQNSHPSLLA